MKRRSVLAVTAAGVVTTAAGCTDKKSASGSSSSAGSLTLSDSAWSYDPANDVYYQIGRYYVTTPAAKDYESLAVFVSTCTPACAARTATPPPTPATRPGA